MKKPLVLILGAESGPAEEVGRAITDRCGSAVELRYATDDRGAQRLVRRELFVAIVAAEPGFLDFCEQMMPDLTTYERPLDVIVAVPDEGYNREYDDLPYGVIEFESADAAAAEVQKAVHQASLDAESRRVAYMVDPN